MEEAQRPKILIADDKEFILNRVKNLNERIIDNQYLNFNFSENENEINLFFDLKTYNLIGWQTLDVYQNLSITSKD